MKRGTALKLVKDELRRATSDYGTFASCHEGYAVILEELDELWAEIKANSGTTHRATSEAVQTAAMAIRYLMDLCEEPTAKEHERKVQRYFGDSSYGSYSG